MYVGSSSSLARRLIGYFKGTHADVGKFIPLLRKEGVSAFSLEVIPLIENYNNSQELSIEQYFLLQPDFNLNTLRVVNQISGSSLDVPAAIYLNAELQRKQILDDNKEKSGIYL